MLLLALFAAFTASSQLDINRATLEEVRRLPVDSALAERIYERVLEYGRLSSFYELAEVPGMDARKLSELAPLIYVSRPQEEARRQRIVHRVQRRLASEEGPTASAVEEWQDMLLAPVNVNRARVDDLTVLDGVSLVDAVAVRKFLDSGGKITEQRDLANRVPGLSSYGYWSIRDFVAYEDQRAGGTGGSCRAKYESDSDWEGVVSAREYAQAISVLEEDSAEFRAAGFTPAELEFYRSQLAAGRSLLEQENRAVVESRVSLRSGEHFRTGLYLQRRFFEPLGGGQYAPGDVSWFLSHRGLGPFRRLMVGDFRVALGQGLLLDNDPGLMARSHERAQGLFSSLTPNPGFGFRGLAAETEEAGPVGLLGFVSQCRHDAVLNPDFSANCHIVTKPRYPSFQGAVEETDGGGSLRFDLSGILGIPTGTRLALNGLGVSYDREFKPNAKYLEVPGDGEELNDPNYTRLASGSKRLFYGADFRTAVENVSVEAELALQRATDSAPGTASPKAYLVKARTQYNYLYVNALYRHYDIGYDNPYSRGYCEQLRFEDTPLEKPYRLLDPAYSALQDLPVPKAEQGFLVETRYQISRQITFTRAYVDIWRNLAWGVDNVRFQGEVEFRPIFPIRLRFRQKLQSKGLPKTALTTRSFTAESNVMVMASLAGRDFLTAEVREGRVLLAPNPTYGDEASMSGNFLSVQWEHSWSEDFSTELGIGAWMTRDMSQWLFEDTGIDFLEGDGSKWYAAVSDRVSDRLLVYLKCRYKTSSFPRTGLGNSEELHYPGSSEPVRDFTYHENRLGVSLQVDLFW